jgi:hypothetical protein
MSGEDKRRFKRYDVEGIEGTLVLNFEARVLNLSLTGLQLSTSTALRSGTRYALRVPSPQGELRFHATVRWCRLTGTEKNARDEFVPVYHAGLDFRDELDQQARELLSFIESHVVVELERRLAGRFTVSEDTSLEIGARGDFVARRLSRSGMLIETDLVPEKGALLSLEVRHDRHPWKAGARVAYVGTRPNGEGAELGIEFVDLSAPAVIAVEAVIEEVLT